MKCHKDFGFLGEGLGLATQCLKLSQAVDELTNADLSAEVTGFLSGTFASELILLTCGLF